jgi:hypothetical protein
MSSTDTDIGFAETLDYGTSAELFSLTGRRGRRQPLDYRRFASAAEAIRFAIEGLSSQGFMGSCLEVDDSRYGSTGIRRLYESSRPLPRKPRAIRSSIRRTIASTWVDCSIVSIRIPPTGSHHGHAASCAAIRPIPWRSLPT